MKLNPRKSAKLTALVEATTKRLCEKDENEKDSEKEPEAQETLKEIGNSLDEFVSYVTGSFFGDNQVDNEKLGKLKKDKAEELRDTIETAFKDAKNALDKIFKAVMVAADNPDEGEENKEQTDEGKDADPDKDTGPEDEPEDKEPDPDEDPADVEVVEDTDDEEQADESVEVDEAGTPVPGVSVETVKGLVRDYHLAYSTERGALAQKVVDVLGKAKKYAPDAAKVEQYAYTEIGRLLVYFGGEYDEMDADEFTDTVFNMAAATGIYGEELKKKAAEFGKPEHDRTDLEDEWDSDPDAGFPDWN